MSHSRIRGLSLIAVSIALAACSSAPTPTEAADTTGSSSVSQAMNPTGYGWQTQWGALGGAGNSDPSIVQSGDGVLHAFVRGAADNGLYESHSSDGVSWSAWSGGGGGLASAPQAVATGEFTNLILIFARGADNRIWMRGYAGSNWIPLIDDSTGVDHNVDWMPMGPQVASADPVAAGFFDRTPDFIQYDEIDVYAGRTSSAGAVELWRLSATTGASGGGSLTRATSWFSQPGKPCNETQASCWAWADLGGSLAPQTLRQPFYAAKGDNTAAEVDVVVADQNHQLFHKTCVGSHVGVPNCDANWQALPTLQIAGAPTIGFRPRVGSWSMPDVMVMGADEAFHHSSYYGAAWEAWDAAGGLGYVGYGAASAPTLVPWGNQDLIAITQDRNMNVFYNHIDFSINAWDGWKALPNSVCDGPGNRVAALRNTNTATPNRVNLVSLTGAGTLVSNFFDQGGSTQSNTLACACGASRQTCCTNLACNPKLVCQAGNFCTAL